MTANDDFRDALGEGPSYSDAEIEARLSGTMQAGDSIKRRRTAAAGSAVVLLVVIVGSLITVNRNDSQIDAAKNTKKTTTSIAKPSSTTSTTVVATPSVAIVKSETKTGTLPKGGAKWRAQMPKVTYAADKKFESVINSSLQQSLDQEIANFDPETDVGSSDDGPQEEYPMDVSFSVERNDSSVLTVWFDSYYYFGGANGTSAVWSRSFDMANKKQINIEDLFVRNSRYLIALKDQSSELLGSDENNCYSPEFAKEGLAPKASNFQAFAPKADGLHLIFNKYQATCGAAGTPEVVIAWTKLDPYLSPLGKSLKGNPDVTGCGDIGFTPNTDDMVGDIEAIGTDCKTAKAVARGIHSQDQSFEGNVEQDSEGFHCLGAFDEEGLPSYSYQCSNGKAVVRFILT